MRVLVTGGGGQLATAITGTAPAGVVVIEEPVETVDVTDVVSVQRAIERAGPDVVVNTAAYTAVDRAETERELAFAVNGTGAGHVAAAATRAGARVIHISTDFVFDGATPRPYATTAATNPLSVYGASKLEGERFALERSDGRAVIVRTAWLHSAVGVNFTKTMLRLLAEREVVHVVCDQVGTPTWTVSLAAAIWRLAGATDARGIYHFTDAGVATWYDFAIAIAEEARADGRFALRGEVRPIPTTAYPTPARRPPYSVLDCSRLRDEQGIETVHWRRGVRAVIRELANA